MSTAGKTISRGLFLLLVATVVGVLAGGAWFYHVQEAQMRHAVEAHIQSIAELKISQIVRWRKERLADANLVFGTPYAGRRALDAMATPRAEVTVGMFTGWLDPLMASEPYERAMLLDSGLKLHLVHPRRASSALCGETLNAAAQAVRSRRVVVADLHRAPTGAVHLSFAIPFVVRVGGDVPAAGLPPKPDDRTAAVLILEANAQNHFYPLLRAWPTPSRTAEIVLLRREGDSILLLNDVRHSSNTALSLRIPLSQADQVEVHAVMTDEPGIFYGKDYRGVPVVAYCSAIPESPWFMVAKIDAAEAFSDWRFRSVFILALLAALVVLAVTTMLVLWQRNQKAHYQRLFRAEAALRDSEQRFRRIYEESPVAYHSLDGAGSIADVNPAWLKLLGYGREEVVGRSLEEFLSPASQAAFEKNFPDFRDSGVTHGEEYEMLCKDGRLLTLAFDGVFVRDPHDRPHHSHCVLHNITERKLAESERERVIMELKEALAKVKQLSGLLPICASCKNVRDDQGYWTQIEAYIRDHSEADFTHGLCPECMKKLYPEYADRT
ncbi:MAG: PAS domain S-box protein [Candidatus Sumerlaeia bacterium]|nr:PAS domain S-box protein [Candidatus Sumerlaeia bacterium]